MSHLFGWVGRQVGADTVVVVKVDTAWLEDQQVLKFRQIFITFVKAVNKPQMDVLYDENQ